MPLPIALAILWGMWLSACQPMQPIDWYRNQGTFGDDDGFYELKNTKK